MDLRLGKISSVNYVAGTVRVAYSDFDDMVSKEIPVLSFEYDMPNVGDSVFVAYYASGRGICIGKYYNSNYIPPEPGANIYKKEFENGAYIKYDRDSNTMTLKADNVVIDSNVSISGNLNVSGTITGSNFP